ncbi:NAD(P)H-binding protein [Mucilaginibacter sp. BT774]|uniref:NAD(P)H-binding protein n=1 Tax=Mucilaginibacter sp. BT774 TaxID=3062276 RepID=UPI0026749C0F|nr:NAD(P)H-binding protein [Mucilaginibacter sp. BT774]MDO3626993.1 NAD(P)H-binding protein [Mucilaginibacter sp. BT774]
MKVLLAGANSYIGTHLIHILLEKGHHVVCLVRDKNHFLNNHPHAYAVTVLGGDLLRRQSIDPLPEDIDAACYLINTYTQTSEFSALAALSAQNFMEVIAPTNCRQVITLSDINDKTSSDSRLNVEYILRNGKPALTVLNTSMIVGIGSAALEMFNILISKTPLVVPRSWIKTRIQPIATSDVLQYIEKSLLNEHTFNRRFDIGGPEILTFKQMMLIHVAIHATTKPDIVILPFLTSHLSSNLRNSLTPLSYPESRRLIENLKHDCICRDNSIRDVITVPCLTFKQAAKSSYETAHAGNLGKAPLVKSN